MKRKVVVLGSLGMAGHIIAEYLSDTGEYEIFGIARQSGNYVDKVMDITDFKSLEEYLNDTKPDYVLNCIGALVFQSKDNLPSAILLNSYLPNFLSQVGSELNFKLIHISTDCVFSGKDGQYTENSYRDGDDNYARTKALGEVINDKDLTIRTSIIGPELKTNGTGLLDWFLKQQDSFNGYTQAYWSGVTTLELAKAVVWAIENDITGLYHVTNNKSINKNDLLNLFKKYTKKNIEIIAVDGKKVDKSFIDTRKEINYVIPDYETMVKDMINLMRDNELYSQYNIGNINE